MVKDLSPIKQRTLKALDFIGVSKQSFFEKAGIAASNFKGVGAKSEMGGDTIVKVLSSLPSINPEWLMTGEGPLLKRDKATALAPQGLGIPLIPIEAMAGFGVGEFVVEEHELERFVVPTFKGADYLIGIKGNSMYPKYSSGDVIACKRLTLSDIFFQWGKVYVLDTEQGALVKRITEGKDEHHILCVSDNKSYPPFQLPREKLNAIALVMGVIRLE